MDEYLITIIYIGGTVETIRLANRDDLDKRVAHLKSVAGTIKTFRVFKALITYTFEPTWNETPCQP